MFVLEMLYHGKGYQVNTLNQQNNLNENYQLEILDYFKDSQNFENLLKLKEEEADIIIYDQTISSLSEAQDYPYLSGYRPKEQKVYLTLTGNLKPEEFIKDLKSLYEQEKD